MITTWSPASQQLRGPILGARCLVLISFCESCHTFSDSWMVFPTVLVVRWFPFISVRHENQLANLFQLYNPSFLSKLHNPCLVMQFNIRLIRGVCKTLLCTIRRRLIFLIRNNFYAAKRRTECLMVNQQLCAASDLSADRSCGSEGVLTVALRFALSFIHLFVLAHRPVLPDLETSERSSVQTLTACLSAESTTTGNRTLVVSDHKPLKIHFQSSEAPETFTAVDMLQHTEATTTD